MTSSDNLSLNHDLAFSKEWAYAQYEGLYLGCHDTQLMGLIITKLTKSQCYKTFYVRNLLIYIVSWSVCKNKLERLVKDKRSSIL
jgi:hypothetical protein